VRDIDVRDPACVESEKTEDVKRLWPQARLELLGFALHLDTNAAITAAQLRMALRLATEAARTKIEQG
jgi:hypothetical protein